MASNGIYIALIFYSVSYARVSSPVIMYVFLRSVDRCLHGLCKKSETSDMRIVFAPVSGRLEAHLAKTCSIPEPSVKMTWHKP
jgi:hypothetical protein